MSSSVSDDSSTTTFDETNYMQIDPSDMFSSEILTSHAVFGPLMESNLIERFNIYKRINNTSITPEQIEEQSQFNGHEEVMAVDVKIGTRLNAHVGIVHGGIISLLFDTSLGYACANLIKGYAKDAIALTANLKVDFRAPFSEKSGAVIRVYLDKVERSKLFLSAVLQNMDGSVTYAEAASLFIKRKLGSL